ncbi:MAG: hypothetical protein IPN33_05845 [Saprospiraceae bacterium]|nr:hypothetical protein [Saprospiraceae bacterium]
MVRLAVCISLVLFLFSATQAQEGQAPNPCGTQMGRNAWLKRYQQAPESFPKSNTTLYVPLTIHLLGTDSGLGYFSVARLLDAFCTLNNDFEEADIRYFIEGDILFLANSFWNSHPDVLDGAAMMFENNVANTINCYFLADPAGNCGYNLPYAGIAIRKDCSDAADHTWAHELGHALSIPHPFIGWENGGSYGNPPHNYNNPAPPFVTYDYTYFKDTLIIDTLIIDTAFVELVDGSNCTFAADGFCDTSPDYLADRWDCNANSESSTLQTDPLGVQFRSDGTLIMSYSNDLCANRFSPEQIAAMRANLLDEKPHLLYNQTADAPVSGSPVILQPANAENVPFNQIELQWQGAQNATHYLVQVSRLAAFPSGITLEYIVTDTQLVLPALDVNKTYYWRVRPFNRQFHCTATTPHQSFHTAEATSLIALSGVESLQLVPNLLPAGGVATLEVLAQRHTSLQAILFSPDGRSLQQRIFDIHPGTNRYELPLDANLPAGLYLLQCTDDQGGRHGMKLVVANGE